MDKNITDLINNNIALAKSIAANHSAWENGNSLSYEDRVGEALLGLVEAAKTWNPERAAFSTYATKVIKNKIIQASRQYNNPYAMSWDTHTILRDMNRAVSAGVDNKVSSIADYLKINPKKIEELWNYHIGAVDIDEDAIKRIRTEDIADSVIDSIDSDNQANRVRRAINALPPKHREIIKHRFGFVTGQPMLSKEVQSILNMKKNDYYTSEALAIRTLKKLLGDMDIELD